MRIETVDQAATIVSNLVTALGFIPSTEVDVEGFSIVRVKLKNDDVVGSVTIPASVIGQPVEQATPHLEALTRSAATAAARDPKTADYVKKLQGK